MERTQRTCYRDEMVLTYLNSVLLRKTDVDGFTTCIGNSIIGSRKLFGTQYEDSLSCSRKSDGRRATLHQTRALFFDSEAFLIHSTSMNFSGSELSYLTERHV